MKVSSYSILLSFLIAFSIVIPKSHFLYVESSSPVISTIAHVMTSTKAIGSQTSKAILQNASQNYNHSDQKKSSSMKSKTLRRPIHVNLFTFLKTSVYNTVTNTLINTVAHAVTNTVNRVQDRVSRVFNRLRNKSSRNRILAEKRLAQTADIILSATKLLSHAQSNDESELYGDLSEDIALSMAYLSNDQDLWQLINEEQGIRVWKTHKPLCEDKQDKKWVCVMTKTVIHAPASKLRKLLLDSDKVTLLNRYSCGRTDVEVINPHCKVVWTRSRIPFTIKPFDFCTLIRDYVDPKSGMILIISKAVEHPLVPVTKNYARSHVIFGLNVLIPSKDDPNITQFISVNHVKYGGIYAALASSGAYQGTVNYILQLRNVAPDLIKEM